MPLTPQDIVRKEFREALRGYNEADVDLFLDEVVEEFTRMTEENQKLKVRLAALQQEIARLRESRGATGGATQATPGGLDAERLEYEVRSRLRRFLEEQLRLLDASAPPPPPTPTVERIAREVPQPPRRAPEPPPRQEPEEPRIEGSREPFWAGE